MNPIKETVKDITKMLGFLGIALILFAILILVYPDLLSYLVGSLLCIAGISMLFYRFRLKKSYKEAEKFWKKFEE
ncbi:MAG TPA: hypothetical protein PLD77_01640 [Candidatus Dojkabacteria bacterium]|nr:hypothetical protein [Candidatus Dojkabacteria bacterium]